MAIYKIFPSQDNTLYSVVNTTNAGMDEMLEVGSYNNRSGILAPTVVLPDVGADDIRRAVLLFDTDTIREVVKIASASFSTAATINNNTGSRLNISSSLRLFVATGENLTALYRLEAHPISQQWVNGLGKYADIPNNTAGSSWRFRTSRASGVEWSVNNISTTASFLTRGGGSWFTGYSASQEFSFTSNKDVNMDITKMVNAWTGSERPNYGVIVKLPSTDNSGSNLIFENNVNSYGGLKFYSVDTHTIYPPCLEIKWSDYSFNTGSTTYNVIQEDSFELVSTNNLGKYKGDSEYKFNFRAREVFPVRQFTTQSVYLSWKYLPEQTYYGIQDYKTTEMVVDFDPIFTKLSVTPSGSEFKLYMNGLEPERSYKILIKTELASGETIIKDNDIIFKVVR